MKINGTSSMNIPAGAIGMDAGTGEQTDPMVRDLQRQIEDLQKRMKELSSNPEMTREMKSKKRQELQKQISDLEMQLRQRQMEVKREEAMKRSSKDYSKDEMLGTEQQSNGRAGKKSAGLSAGSMEAMISADASMKQADVHGSVARKMEGRAGVLEAEIKQDEGLGFSVPGGKREQLAEVESKANEATVTQMGALAQAEKAARKANEADQDRDTAKSEKNQSTNKAEDDRYKGTAKEDEEDDKDGSVAERSDESNNFADSSTFDVVQLGVPFSRGYNPVDVKL